MQGPVIYRGHQLRLHRRRRDAPGRLSRVERLQIQIALRERSAVFRRGDPVVEVAAAARVLDPEPFAVADVVQLLDKRDVLKRLLDFGESVRAAPLARTAACSSVFFAASNLYCCAGPERVSTPRPRPDWPAAPCSALPPSAGLFADPATRQTSRRLTEATRSTPPAPTGADCGGRTS